ncbi:hypothetical protein LC608_10510 [Nostoc sp. XA010]|uniref:PIN domain-containing protein n=1 Tax=Nostoc sp. XA010 TaxID=2780407 RepID=UPI001E3C8C1C|nr:PIN domain-containing protein [Nostoc sp. XA010]MCC5657410.1 hypothetical protein [Nostoc sp. XA010]
MPLQTLLNFLKQFYIIKIDQAVSDTAVDLLRSYRLSHNLAIPDSLIAATAIVWNYPFLTKNQRDYRFIQGLNLLPYP